MSSLTQSQLEFAGTIKQDEVPIKLRCAVCNKLNVNAFKLPCCDQSICESCHSSLPESCPVCAHSPVTVDDCTIHKSLRQTVKIWIKSQEKKRDDKERAAAAAASQPIGTAAAPDHSTALKPVDQLVESAKPPVSHNQAELDQQDTVKPHDEALVIASSLSATSQSAITEQPSSALKDEDDAQAISDAQPVADTSAKAEEGDGPTNGIEKEQQEATSEEKQEPDARWNMNDAQQQMFNGGFGFDPSQAGFGNVDWSQNGGFNPLMAMQMNGNWTGFPNMMGMSNLGMDPMSMQNGMFGNFGGMNNMGMNGMNMGMGFNAGGGGFGGWNGQMSNDFSNGGYYPNGGYNQSHQGHYPQQMHYQQQQFHKNSFQNRNRFQGHSQKGYGQSASGGYGAQSQNYGAGYGHGHAQSQGQHQAPNQSQNGGNQATEDVEDAFTQQLPQHLRDTNTSEQTSNEQSQESAAQNDPEGKATQSDAAREVVESNQPKAEGHSNGPDDPDDTNTNKNPKNDFNLRGSNAQISGEGVEHTDAPQHEPENGVDESIPHQSQTAFAEQQMNRLNDSTEMQLTSEDSAYNTQQIPYSMAQDPSMRMGHSEFSYRGRGGMRGGYGRGGYNEYRGGYGGRGGRGGFNAYGGGMPADVTVVTPQEPQGMGVEGAPTGPKAMRERQSQRGRGDYTSASNRRSTITEDSVMDRQQDASPLPDSRRSRSRSGSQSRHHSRSRSHSPAQPRSHSHSRSRSRTPSRKHRHHHRHRSRSANTPSETESRERRHERRKHRSRKDKYDEDDFSLEDRHDEYNRRDKESRSRDESVDSRHRTNRRDKDRHRSSRSYRDRSRDYKRHKHRSPSPSAAFDANDAQTLNGGEHPISSGHNRRKSRSEKHGDRDYSRDEERERERDKDRERDRERRRSRRDRSASPNDERDHKTSRRSRKDRDERREKDRERDRDRDRDRDNGRDRERASTSALPTPTDNEFKIQGKSRDSRKPSITIAPLTMSSMQPPTGPKSAARIPTGPAAQRRPSVSSQQSSDNVRRKGSETPTTPAASGPPASAVDPYQAEREAAIRMRVEKEARRRQSLQSSSERKRSFADLDAEQVVDDKSFSPPTGPSADRNWQRKRHRASESGGRKLSRRVSYKYEDEENDEQRARRVEHERESARYH